MIKIPTERVTVEGFEYEHITDPTAAHCEVDHTPPRPAHWIVTGMQLCDDCFNADSTKCPQCRFRSAGDYLTDDWHIECRHCGFKRPVFATE